MLRPWDSIVPLDSENEFQLEKFPMETAVKPSRSQLFKMLMLEDGQFCKCKEHGNLMVARRWTFPLQWLPMTCLYSCKYPKLNSTVPQAHLGRIILGPCHRCTVWEEETFVNVFRVFKVVFTFVWNIQKGWRLCPNVLCFFLFWMGASAVNLTQSGVT